MEWEYGKMLLKEEQIESLDNWSDDKEYAYSIMDRKYDYLWWEDEKGIHFIDRLYHDYGNQYINEDELLKKRKEANELELHFKTIEKVIEWLKRKEDKLSEKRILGYMERKQIQNRLSL